MSRVLPIKDAEHVANRMKAIANKHRLQILNILIERKEVSVGEIVEALPDLKQSPISQHLAKLKEEGIVKFRKQNQSRFYSISNENIVDLIESIQMIFSTEYEEIFEEERKKAIG